MLAELFAFALTVVALPDPGTSAAGAAVAVNATRDESGAATGIPAGGANAVARSAVIGADNRASVDVPAGRYTVDVTKSGFVPARASIVVPLGGATVRVALHAVPGAALRTIGSVGAAERGAFNRAPTPVEVLPREGYRDQGQPGTTTVLTQTPSLTVDRAGRGIDRTADQPPVALVRGGTPLETQILLEGVPVMLPSTRTLALSTIPAFMVNEFEIQPGAGAPLPVIDGALNGTVNIRLPEPTPVWRALPELGVDGRGGSFADLTAGGGLANRRIGIALAATSNGMKGPFEPLDVIQRALLLKVRAALSPAATFTVTGYSESDSNRIDSNSFGFTTADLRVSGRRDTVQARWWHAGGFHDGAGAVEPFTFRTDDSLTGASLELNHTAGGENVYSLAATETYGRGSALGLVDVNPGSYQRVQTAFARAILHPARHVETQVTLYDVRADMLANRLRLVEGGAAARLGAVFRPTSDFALRGSVGAGFTPPSLIALASLGNTPGGVTTSSTTDLGFDKRVFDAETTLSLDVFSTHESHRLIEDRRARWTDAGEVERRGAELSLARRPRSGLGYLLQAWTASETPALAPTAGDVASGATHGYAEISYHSAQGSRVSLGATYWGADPLLTQPAVVMLNTNVEIQVGARGKIQFSVENLNDAARAVISRGTPFLNDPSPFAPGPRTVRLLLRRSFGRTGPDGG